MFENFDIKQFTWRREPVLILAFLIALLQIVAAIVAGDVQLVDGLETIVTIVFGFVARGQVTPVN